MTALGANRKKEPQHSTGALGEGTRAISSDTTPEHCSHLGNPLPYFALEGRGTSGVSAGAEPVGLSHSLRHMAGCRDMLGRDHSIHLHCGAHYDAGTALHDFQAPPTPRSRYSHITPSSSCSLQEPLAVLRIIFIRN